MLSINRVKNIIKKSLIILAVFSWVFSGWFQVLNFHPKTNYVLAAQTVYTISDGSLTAATVSGGCDTSLTNTTASDGAQGTVVTSTCIGRNDTPVVKWTKTLTWESMGVPSGATVTQVDGNFKYRVAQETHSAVQAMGVMQLRDSGDSAACAASDLEASFDPGAVNANYTTRDTSGAINVSAGCDTSATSVTIRLDMTPKTGNNASATSELRADDVSLTITYFLPTFEQSAYHFFNNANSTDVGSELTANQDTPVTLATTGDAFRMRLLLHVATSQLTASGQNFKLQFAEQSGTCDTSFSGETYADVTGATVIAYSTANTPADGDNLTANAEDPIHGGDTIVNQDYEEANNFTNTVAAIPSGQDGKWDFSLIDNGATASTAYCFRVRKSDDTNIDTYTVIPQITTDDGVSPPTLTFSVSDNDIFFGTLSSSASQWADNTADGSTTAAVAHTLTASTNATNGYTITVKGATLTSTSTPGDTITAMGTEATLTTGQEEFGLRITSSGGNGTVNTDYDNTPANSYFYGATASTTDVIATDADGDDISTTYSLYYATDIATTTEAHTDYQATLTYVATGNF